MENTAGDVDIAASTDCVGTDESPVVCEPFTTWKDPRGYNSSEKCCAPCFAKGRRVALTSKAKALNHWACDGSGKDPSATIKDCLLAAHVPGLMQFARAQNQLKILARRERQLEEDLQRQKDAAEASSAQSCFPGSVRLIVECVRSHV